MNPKRTVITHPGMAAPVPCQHARTKAAYAVVPKAESPTGKRSMTAIGRICLDCNLLLPTSMESQA